MCDDPVADVDMEEDKDADSELEEYSDTPPISSWAPPSALPGSVAGAPIQPAALGMPPIPRPPPPAGQPAAAEPGCAPQAWKCPNWGAPKRKHDESSEGVKRQKVAGGAASTMQQGSAYAPIHNWLAGGAPSAAFPPAATPGWGGAWNLRAADGDAKQVAGPAAVLPAALANPPAQRRVGGEEPGRRAGSEAETARRVMAQEEANRFLAEGNLLSFTSTIFVLFEC